MMLDGLNDSWWLFGVLGEFTWIDGMDRMFVWA